MSPFNLYTIGYTGFTPDAFIAALKGKSVGAVVDVRSSPHSARYVSYDIRMVAPALKGAGIFYLHLGRELGARPEDPSLYTNNAADFGKMARAEAFIAGCRRVRDGLNRFPVCLMCAEKDPATCHRTILVANALRLMYPELKIFHIVPPSETESQQALDRRLLVKHHLEKEHFFKSYEQRLQEAYALQGRKIAWDCGNENE